MNQKQILGFLAGVLLFVPALAADYSGKINSAGSHSGGTGVSCFVGLSDNSAAGCLYGNMYFDCSNAGGKAQYAAMLTALATDKSVFINYNKDTASTCRVAGYLGLLK